jgi:hypothetical protein
MNPGYMSAEELQQSINWMEMHGQAVTAFVMNASMVQAQQLEWFWNSASALTRLKQLEMEHQKDSLFLLAPVLGQLPHLQHLAACVSVAAVQGPGVPVLGGGDEASPSQFVYSESTEVPDPWEAPDLQQLCPQLTHLHLSFHSSDYCLVADGQLPRLLPARLQQLSLADGGRTSDMWVQSSSLVHLSALQQLTLESVQVAGQRPGSVAQDLAALRQLRQLRLVQSNNWVKEGDVMRHLAPKILSCEMESWCLDVRYVLPRLIHLTQLALCAGWSFHSVEAQGIADALTALTDLQELSFVGAIFDSSYVAVLQLVAGMSNLRSLSFSGLVDDDRLSAEGGPSLVGSLAQFTQLTSLVVAATRICDLSGHQHVCALQQLTGLRCLTVPGQLLKEAGAWLAPLTALTRLCVRVSLSAWETECEVDTEGCSSHQVAAAVEEPRLRREAEELLEQVQAWPASLQQVVMRYTFNDGGERYRSHFKPGSWQFTPAVQSDVQLSVWIEEESSTAS